MTTQRRGTFWCENSIFDVKALNAHDILVYCLLARQAEGKDGRSKQSTKLLATRARLSERTVQVSVRLLDELHIIAVEPGGGRGKLNVYRVRPRSQWLETPQEVRGKSETQSRQRSRRAASAETPQETTRNPAGDSSETPHHVRPEGLTALRDLQLEGSQTPPAASAAGCEVLPPGFAEFWDQYPAKEGRAKALAEWLKLAPDERTVVRILRGLALWLASDRWAKGFIARPAKWLRARSWEDSPAPHLLSRPETFAVLRRAHAGMTVLRTPGPAAPPRAHRGEEREERAALIHQLIEQGVSAYQAEDRADAIQLARRALTAGAPSGDDSGAVRGSR
jgi:hypothetical protein